MPPGPLQEFSLFGDLIDLFKEAVEIKGVDAKTQAKYNSDLKKFKEFAKSIKWNSPEDSQNTISVSTENEDRQMAMNSNSDEYSPFEGNLRAKGQSKIEKKY